MSRLVKILITILLTTGFIAGCWYGIEYLSDNFRLIDTIIIIIILILTLLIILLIGGIIFEILDVNF